MAIPAITSANVRRFKALQLKRTEQGTLDIFGCRPVFLVELTTGTKLVVKQEVKNHATSQKAAVFGAKIMKHIDGETKAAPVTVDELNALSPLRTFVMGGRGGLNAPTDESTKSYFSQVREEDAGGLWIKMLFVEGLKGLDSILEDQGETRNLLLDMRVDDRILETLGEVAAGDIFLGNQDRFSHSGAERGKIANVSNILFKIENGTKGLGLDWFQAQGQNSNLFRPPTKNWAGPMLNNPQEMLLFARNAVTGLNDRFASKLDDLRTPDLLTEHNVGNFEDGMISGRDKLKRYLQDKVAKDATNLTKKVPGGVMIRMQILGW